VDDLDALASGSRSSMKGPNEKIMGAIRSLSDACSADPVDVEAAVSACEDARSAVGDAKPPTDEDETKISSGSSGGEFTNPLDTQPKSSGAQ
jgi:hypothetical protein